MGLRSVEEYKKSLRDGRTVYYRGELIPDVTKHRHLGVAVEHASIDYSVAEDPVYRDLATVQLHGGAVCSRYYNLPASADDLLKRSRLIETCTRIGGTMVTLIKEIGTDSLFALHLVAAATDQKFGTQYLPRVREFFDYCRSNDLALAVAQTDVKGDRSKGPHEQSDPDMYVRVVEENSEGIVVRGAKVHTSVSINANEIIVIPTRAMSENDKAYAVAFAVPANAKGLKLVAAAYSEAPVGREFDYPLSSRHQMVETLTIFDNVFVPWDRVFMKGETAMAGVLAKTFVDFHRFTAISYKLPLVDLLLGSAELMADYNGITKASHVRDKVTWLVAYAETLRALVKMAALECSVQNGIAVPNVLICNMAKWHFAQHYHDALFRVQDIAGGLLATAPSGEDVASSALGAEIRKYLAGRQGVNGEDRLRALNLVKELTTSDFAGYHAVLAVHAEGSIEAEKLAVLREHDNARFIALAKEMCGIKS